MPTIETSFANDASPRRSPFPVAAICWGLAGLVVLTSINIMRTAERIPLNSPPSPGDGPDYESIAWNLSRGRDFATDFTDPEWREPYLPRAAQLNYGDLMDRPWGYGLTAYRPPLFPLMVAGIYKLIGRRFDVVRIANCIWMAAAVAVFIAAAYRHFGAIASGVLLATAAVDTELHAYAGTFLTESLSAFWMSAVLVAVPARFDGAWRRNVLIAGFCFGILILTRSIFVLWIPLMLPAIWLMVRQPGEARLRKAVTASALFVGSAVLVASPWWIRNCVVLEGLRPLGTQGAASLVGGYCDDSLDRGGLWSGDPQVEISAEVRRDPTLAELTLPQREVLIADRCLHEAKRWAWAHAADLPRHSLGKLYHLWYRPSFLHTLFYLPVAIGILLAIRHSPLRWPVLALIINSLLVMVLYSTGGRFLLPLRPALHFLAAAATATVLIVAWSTVTRSGGATKRQDVSPATHGGDV